MKRILVTSLLACSFQFNANAASWTPQLRFNLEGLNHSEALIFVSGLAYGLAYSEARLSHEGKKNYYCLPSGQRLDSQLLVELLNQKLSGRQSAEAVTSTVVVQLAEKYPCR